MAFTPYGVGTFSQINVATPLAGFALQNGTPNIISYTTPNDGKIHFVFVAGEVVVSVGETGGQLSLNFTDPGGTPRSRSQDPGGHAAGYFDFGSSNGGQLVAVAPNTTVTLLQSVALTVGAAVVYAGLFST